MGAGPRGADQVQVAPNLLLARGHFLGGVFYGKASLLGSIISLHQEVSDAVAGYLQGDYQTTHPQGVPLPENIPLGNSAAELEATTLFLDVRQSSDITNAFRRQTAAKMMKAYFSGSVKIINSNDGQVRSFNGDGMLAIFVGNRRSNNAVKAAMQVKRFVGNILEPQFRRYFANNQQALGRALDFSVGAGLDEGTIFAVRVGIRGTNDVAWVGRCTNTSAKLSNITQSPNNIAITRAVYERLNQDRKFSNDAHMWSDEQFREFGGVRRAIRTTSFYWRLGAES
jgi:adenylate cyclase